MSAGSPRLLFYSHGGVGIGHFRRQLRLALAFRERHPEAALLFITGSHAAEVLSAPLGLDCISLPSIRTRDRYATWEPRQAGLSIEELMRIRADLLRRTVRRFRPDLLIADFMPAGPYGELVGALEELERHGGKAVAGFRDIIDEPGFVRDLWERTGVYDVLREHYAAICVYGERGVMDFELDYGLQDLAARVHYLGYLGRRLAVPVAGASAGAGPELLACAGGGVDGGALLSCFVSAAARFEGRRLVVGGPLLSDDELAGLRRQADGSGIEVVRFMADLDRRISSSDLVVMMPGYNTSCELLSCNARAIVVPRAGPSLEQRIRAAWLERWGRALPLQPGELSVSRLTEAITASLDSPPPPPAPVRLDGLRRAVALLASLAVGEPISLVA